jgi:hypothetical protein
MVKGSRQAGAHPLSGDYQFEVLRTIIGDDAAERASRIEYKLKERSPSKGDVGDDCLDFVQRDRDDLRP